MPWTEYFCSFDRFLRGGPDLELGLLALASVVCMVLVLVQHARVVLARILSLYQRLSFLIMRTVLRIPARSLGTVAALSPPGSRGLHPSMYNLPMQV